MEIKVLARRGMAVREIVRQTGLSRNTVRRYLRDERADRYKHRDARPTKLDPFKNYLKDRAAAARPHRIPATVLLRELREIGYDGGISQLKVFMAALKQPEPDPVVRSETPPGKQMQADFTVIRRGRSPLLALVATPGCSRASSVRFAAREDATTLCQCLHGAFVYFGGTPEQVLFDNAKSVIIERDAAGCNGRVMNGSGGSGSLRRIGRKWVRFRSAMTNNSAPRGNSGSACRRGSY